MSMPMEVTDPTQGVNVYHVVGSLILEKDKSEGKNKGSIGQQPDRWSLIKNKKHSRYKYNVS